MEWTVLDLLGDARITFVDKRPDALVYRLDCANAEHLSIPIRELRFFDYSITQDADLTGCTWHRHSLTAGPVFQTLELTAYAPATRRKPSQRQTVFQFKRMEIIP